MIQIIDINHSLKDIYKKRLEIGEQIIRLSSNLRDRTINSISTGDLKVMLELYDEIFLYRWFKNHYRGKLEFSLSRRMTKSAGITLCPKNVRNVKEENLVIEIRIGVDFFFQYNVLQGNKNVCGVTTNNSLEALQLVFEHELCHAMEFICFGESSCKKERFKALANNIFGHTESYHVLPTNRQIASKKLNLHLGDFVTFEFENKKLNGILHNINKRGTVMVQDKKGCYQDKSGNRYSKYYVPLEELTKKNM